MADDKVEGDKEVTVCMSVDPVSPVRRPMPPVERDTGTEPTCSIMSEKTSVSPQQETGADEPHPQTGFLFEVDGIPLKMIYEVLDGFVFFKSFVFPMNVAQRTLILDSLPAAI